MNASCAVEITTASKAANASVVRVPTFTPRAAQVLHVLLTPPRRLEEAVRQALQEAQGDRHLLLASYSAAQWLAPFARQSSTFFDADRKGLELLQRLLQLQPVDGGGNVFVAVKDDDLVFKRRLESAPGIWCTGLVDTWLDLSLAGDRGVEAADHLLQQRWKPAWDQGT